MLYNPVHPCTAELFVNVFCLFLAGIANAIPSYKHDKRKKICPGKYVCELSIERVSNINTLVK